MKTLTLLLVVFCLFSAHSSVYAQPDSTKIAKKVLFYADSLVKTDAYQSWTAYAELAPLTVIKFYGGKDGYVEHCRVARMRTLSTIDENYPDMKIQTLMTENEQWQS